MIYFYVKTIIHIIIILCICIQALMNIIPQLNKLIEQRIEFIQQLVIVTSFKEMININMDQSTKKHIKMQSQQINFMKMFMNSMRIDDKLKKEYHIMIGVIFKKIDPSYSVRISPTGKVKDIISDYTQFFIKVRQHNILDFLCSLFSLNIYNQSTLLFVLIEILLKYFRVKTLELIKQEKMFHFKNQKISKPDKLNKINKSLPMNPKKYYARKDNSRLQTQKSHHLEGRLHLQTEAQNDCMVHNQSYLSMRTDHAVSKNLNKMFQIQEKNIITNQSRTKIYDRKTPSLTKSRLLIKNQRDKKRLQNQTLNLIPKTQEPRVQSGRRRLNTSDNIRESPQVWDSFFGNGLSHNVKHEKVKNQRRVIKSYKCIKQQTNQRINKSTLQLYNQNLLTSNNRQNYLRAFVSIYKEQWSEYLKLILIQSQRFYENILNGNQAVEEQTINSNDIVEKIMLHSRSPKMSRKKCPIFKNDSNISANSEYHLQSNYFSGIKESNKHFINNVKNQQSLKKKKQWCDKYLEKVIVETCYRNDNIRKQMENYCDNYSFYVRL